jgi:hypothetical protein
VQGQRYVGLANVDLSCCPAGTDEFTVLNGATWAADVTVLGTSDQHIGWVTMAEVNVAGSTVIGARIYDSNSHALIASADVPVGAGNYQVITVPISAPLAAGGTYRVGVFAPSGSPSISADLLDPSPPFAGGFPYVESRGLFRVDGGYEAVSDSFPATSSDLIPGEFSLPEPDLASSLLAGAAVILGLTRARSIPRSACTPAAANGDRTRAA